jgi:SAM-dependent methyltransferase
MPGSGRLEWLATAEEAVGEDLNITKSAIRPEWLEQLAQGQWRTPIYYEMVNSELARFGAAQRPTVLDIGCGKCFDGEVKYQKLIAEQAGKFIGIEPDESIEPSNVFTQLFRTSLEGAPIPPSSVHIAFAVMVMEHLAEPSVFWNRLREILVPGGVFLAFTVNAAHWFAPVCRLSTLLKVKGLYLDVLLGTKGPKRYADYPVYYRTNTRARIAKLAEGFSSVEAVPCGPVGIVSYYAPPIIRPAVRAFDTLAYLLNRQRINLIVRAVR